MAQDEYPAHRPWVPHNTQRTRPTTQPPKPKLRNPLANTGPAASSGLSSGSSGFAFLTSTFKPSANPVFCKMPFSFPQEILDLIIDHLPNDPETLKKCCVVSKAWIYGTRKRLFHHVDFQSIDSLRQWRATFPDPLNSPAHCTRILSMYFLEPTTTTDSNTLLTFRAITHLSVNAHRDDYKNFPLATSRGFSPTVRSLHLVFDDLRVSDVIGLIQSFPLLRDLSLLRRWDRGRWNTPMTSPEYTDSLRLRVGGGLECITSELLGPPNGFRFKNITVEWHKTDDVGLTTDLVSRCSGTLESLEIVNFITGKLLSRKSSEIGDSPLYADASRMAPLDLSKAKKLSDVEFMCRSPSVRWVTTTLRGAGTGTLQTISLAVSLLAFDAASRYERLHQEWLTLDHLLVQFWTLHPFSLRLSYQPVPARGLGSCAEKLLPESMRRGIVDLVGRRSGPWY